MKKSLLLSFFISFLLFSCVKTKYKLHKFYRDSNSPAARMMGGTYAGVVDEFDTMEECVEAKKQVERNDRKIGYKNSMFQCSKKSKEEFFKKYNYQ